MTEVNAVRTPWYFRCGSATPRIRVCPPIVTFCQASRSWKSSVPPAFRSESRIPDLRRPAGALTRDAPARTIVRSSRRWRRIPGTIRQAARCSFSLAGIACVTARSRSVEEMPQSDQAVAEPLIQRVFSAVLMRTQYAPAARRQMAATVAEIPDCQTESKRTNVQHSALRSP